MGVGVEECLVYTAVVLGTRRGVGYAGLCLSQKTVSGPLADRDPNPKPSTMVRRGKLWFLTVGRQVHGGSGLSESW